MGTDNQIQGAAGSRRFSKDKEPPLRPAVELTDYSKKGQPTIERKTTA